MSESPKKKVFDVSLLGRVFLFVKPYRDIFYLSLLLAVLMAAFAPVRPYLIQLTLDKATGKAFLIPQWLKAVLFTTDLSDATKFIIAVSIFQLVFLFVETTIRFFFAFITAFLFIVVAVTLIHNTIRINLYSDRFIIKNMELVGASWGFITRPYIRKGIWNGFVSGLLAIGMIGGIWYFAQKSTPELNLLFQSPVFLGSILVLILLGILISWISTFYVVNKYLRMRLDDLY